MLHHLSLCPAAFHLPFNMLSYYIFCCPLLHYCMLHYLTQHYIKPHYITLCHLIAHLISLPILYPVLVCTTPLYPILIHPSFMLQHVPYPRDFFSPIALPCLALPCLTLHYIIQPFAHLTVANTF